MRFIDFSKAHNNLKSILDQVIDDADFTVIHRRDAEDAVVMSMDMFNSLIATLHLLKSPANAEHLKRSIAQYRAGETTEREPVNN